MRKNLHLMLGYLSQPLVGTGMPGPGQVHGSHWGHLFPPRYPVPPHCHWAQADNCHMAPPCPIWLHLLSRGAGEHKTLLYTFIAAPSHSLPSAFHMFMWLYQALAHRAFCNEDCRPDQDKELDFTSLSDKEPRLLSICDSFNIQMTTHSYPVSFNLYTKWIFFHIYDLFQFYQQKPHGGSSVDSLVHEVLKNCMWLPHRHPYYMHINLKLTFLLL